MAQKSNVFDGLDEREVIYVTARVETKSNREALRNTGLSQGWLNKKNIDDLNARATALRTDTALKAQKTLSDAVEQAAQVKVAGLKSRDERVRQAVATEILERIFGRPTQKSEISGPEGGAIEVNDARERIQRKLARIADEQDAE